MTATLTTPTTEAPRPMSTDSNDHAEVLGEAVRARRQELGLSQEALAELSVKLDPRGKGFTSKTVSSIERARRESMHASTMVVLDACLEWPRGTTHALLHGEEPPERPELPADVQQELRDLRARVETLSEAFNALADYIESGRSLERLRNGLSEGGDEPRRSGF